MILVLSLAPRQLYRFLRQLCERGRAISLGNLCINDNMNSFVPLVGKA